MECLHGKAASYNLLEGIYANAIAQEVVRLVESCNGCQVGHPSQRLVKGTGTITWRPSLKPLMTAAMYVWSGKYATETMSVFDH